ncbi:MAG: hypothetical protein RLY14_745 [Planctomycetota bacterium]|jgi:hypothetical protein
MRRLFFWPGILRDDQNFRNKGSRDNLLYNQQTLPKYLGWVVVGSFAINMLVRQFS